jgi:hypothetical protein
MSGLKVVEEIREADGKLHVDVAVTTEEGFYSASPGASQVRSVATGARVTSALTLLLDGTSWKREFTFVKPVDDMVPVGATGAAPRYTMYDFLSARGSLGTALFELFGDAFGPQAVSDALRAWISYSRAPAAHALAARKDAESVRLLSEAINEWRFWMGERRREIRASAIEAAGASGQRAHLDALVKALDAGDHIIRSSAVRALEQLGDPAAVEPLSRLAEDDDDAGNRDQATRAIEVLRRVRR